MARWDPAWLEELRDRNDILSVISETVPLKQQGRNWAGRCPFHDDRTPSFTVSPDKQMFYCFGCQTGGDVITFVMKRDHLSFPEAVAFLARRAGMPMPEDGSNNAAAEQKWREREKNLRVLELATRFFEAALAHEHWGKTARAYLRERGISAEIQKTFRLGYAPPGWRSLTDSLLQRGVEERRLIACGLVNQKNNRIYDRFRDRLMFPIFDLRGRVIAFGGRVLGKGEPKYLNSPETDVFHKRKVWYGLHQARRFIGPNKPAVVMEGYFDVVTAHQSGIGEAVASLGTSLTPEQVKELCRFSKEVIIAYDGDAAGALATLKGLSLFDRHECLVRVADLPAGMDPDDLIRKQGAESLRQKLANALPLFEYRLSQARKRFDVSTVEGRYQVLQEMMPVLLNEKQPVKLAAQRQALAERLGFEESVIQAEIQRFRKKTSENDQSLHIIAKPRNNNSVMSPKTSTLTTLSGVEQGDLQAEEELLRLLIGHPSWVDDVRQHLLASDFSQGAHRTLAEIMLKLRVGDNPSDWFEEVRKQVAESGDALAVQLLAALSLDERIYKYPRRVLEDCLSWLVDRRRLRKRIRELKTTIRLYENEGKPIDKDLLAEYQECLRQLKSGAARQASFSTGSGQRGEVQ